MHCVMLSVSLLPTCKRLFTKRSVCFLCACSQLMDKCHTAFQAACLEVGLRPGDTDGRTKMEKDGLIKTQVCWVPCLALLCLLHQTHSSVVLSAYNMHRRVAAVLAWMLLQSICKKQRPDARLLTRPNMSTSSSKSKTVQAHTEQSSPRLLLTLICVHELQPSVTSSNGDGTKSRDLSNVSLPMTSAYQEHWRSLGESVSVSCAWAHPVLISYFVVL